MVPIRMFRILTLGLAVCLARPVVAQTVGEGGGILRPLAEQGQARWLKLYWGLVINPALAAFRAITPRR